VIQAFDNSGSVACSGGSDPIGNRFTEAGLAIKAVARRCKCGRCLAATLSFDTPTSADVGPTPIRTGLANLEKGLVAPPDGAGRSEVCPSLRVARTFIENYPEHVGVLVVLSDFQLFDPTDWMSELAEFPASQVYAVTLRAPAPQRLSDDPRIKVIQVNHGSEPGSVAKAIFAALTTTRIRKNGRK
jgi:hypothetical protein